jgi:hypothetical protein
MVPTHSLMDIEKHPALLRVDALQKDARGTTTIQFIIVDEIPFGPAFKAPGLGLIFEYCP